jgi:hypothetical protein
MSETEQSPTVLSPKDRARLGRLFGSMPYMLFVFSQEKCRTVDDLLGVLETLRDNVVEAAERARRTEVELMELRSTLRGGAKLLALLQQGMADKQPA